jgi:hypothetical protein
MSWSNRETDKQDLWKVRGRPLIIMIHISAGNLGSGIVAEAGKLFAQSRRASGRLATRLGRKAGTHGVVSTISCIKQGGKSQLREKVCT